MTITNPILIVEVLSPSTEESDRGGKWQHYQLIPSLQECVRRLESGCWEYRDAIEGTLALVSGASLDLTRLYADLPD